MKSHITYWINTDRQVGNNVIFDESFVSFECDDILWSNQEWAIRYNQVFRFYLLKHRTNNNWEFCQWLSNLQNPREICPLDPSIPEEVKNMIHHLFKMKRLLI
jgi:hypothetical protein